MIETLAKQAAVNLFHEEGSVADMNDSEKLDLILNQMGTVNERLGGIDKRLDVFAEEFTGYGQKLTDYGQKLTDTRLYMENVLEHNIRIIAENHKSLVDKLEGAKHSKKNTCIKACN